MEVLPQYVQLRGPQRRLPEVVRVAGEEGAGACSYSAKSTAGNCGMRGCVDVWEP